MKKPAKQLWLVLGPLFVAALLCLLVFAYPWSGKRSQATLQRAAVSLSNVVFKNRDLKVQALSDKSKHYVAFFGSSELNRMDKYHPSVMAAKYHNYTPFLFGSRGTQSLPQMLNMTMMSKQLTNKKAVFIISPQWFTKPGVDKMAFAYYTGSYSDIYWLLQANPKSAYDRYTAQRLIELLGTDGTIPNAAKRIASGRVLTGFERRWLSFRMSLLAHEDNLFSGYFLNNNYQKKIVPDEEALPVTYNYSKLYQQAAKDKAKQSKNNHLGIIDSFYRKQLRGKYWSTKNSQRHFDYYKSPEYGDFETVLKQFQKTNTNVIFVITPVNEKWEKHTGMSMKMYYQTVNKIKFQLQSQGFNNIVDFSHKGNQSSFMNDTIHLGWSGWVDFDRQVSRFIENKQASPNYHVNDVFLSKKWTNLIPTTNNLKQFQKTELK